MNNAGRPWSGDDVEFLEAEWEAGASAEQISMELGRSLSAVYEKASVLGLGARQDGHDRMKNRRRAVVASAQLDEFGRRGDAPAPVATRDDDHWQACLKAGGFPYSYELPNGGLAHVYPNPPLQPNPKYRPFTLAAAE